MDNYSQTYWLIFFLQLQQAADAENALSHIFILLLPSYYVNR